MATHALVHNAANASILIGMRDGMTVQFKLQRRNKATVSVFDSNFLVGDGIWEGVRVNKGRMRVSICVK